MSAFNFVRSPDTHAPQPERHILRPASGLRGVYRVGLELSGKHLVHVQPSSPRKHFLDDKVQLLGKGCMRRLVSDLRRNASLAGTSDEDYVPIPIELRPPAGVNPRRWTG